MEKHDPDHVNEFIEFVRELSYLEILTTERLRLKAENDPGLLASVIKAWEESLPDDSESDQSVEWRDTFRGPLQQAFQEAEEMRKERRRQEIDRELGLIKDRPGPSDRGY